MSNAGFNPTTTTTIPAIVRTLSKRSGRKFVDLYRRILNYLGPDYLFTEDDFQGYFRRKKGPTKYKAKPVLALVVACTQGLPAERRCRPEEAFQLFDLAGIPLADISKLRDIFPEAFEQALKAYMRLEEPEPGFLNPAAEQLIQAWSKQLPAHISATATGEPVKNALKIAIENAVKRYAKGEQLAWARALTREDGLLSFSDVAAELAKILLFTEEPNTALIGSHWRNLLDAPPVNHDFTAEAALWVSYLRGALKASRVFGTLFKEQTPYALVDAKASAAAPAPPTAGSLKNLVELIEARFGDLYEKFGRANFSIRDQIRNFDRYIDEKTRDFVGRRFIFDAIQNFIDANPRGYFIIRGEPGIGKTALSAQLTKTNGYIHHFNVRAEGINKASDFLRNICAQLIAAYALNYPTLPPEAAQDAGFLTKLLAEVSKKLADDKCVIVIDALDEVDNLGMSPGTNVLYLPITLPEGIFIVATSRKLQLSLPIDVEKQILDIESDSAGNIDDVREYVSLRLSRPGIRRYIEVQKIDDPDFNDERFVEMLVQKSQGNFMYLYYVLPEIEKGAYQDRKLAFLPVGLMNYYDDLWARLKGLDKEAWFSYKLPVLVALTVVREPVSVDLISNFSKVREKSRIWDVIAEWRQFLHDEQVNYEGKSQYRYRLYHPSFFDFIAGKEEIAEERVDLKAMHRQIADTLWAELFGNSDVGLDNKQD